MIIVNFPVGKKIFTLQCNEDEVEYMKNLSGKLNTAVNRNSLKHKNLSAESLIFITTLEIIAELDEAKLEKSATNIVTQSDTITNEKTEDEEDNNKTDKLVSMIESNHNTVITLRKILRKIQSINAIITKTNEQKQKQLTNKTDKTR